MMNTVSMKMVLLTGLFSALPCSLSHAAVIVAGAVTSSQSITCTLTITDPLTFQVTRDSPFGFLIVFKSWVVTDGNETLTSLLAAGGLTINGSPSAAIFPSFLDNKVGALGAVKSGDGVLYFHGFQGPSAGDIVTISPGTYTFRGSSSFNPRTVQTFTGSIFLADQDGNAISGVIPEPSTSLLLGYLGTACLLRRRRRA